MAASESWFVVLCATAVAGGCSGTIERHKRQLCSNVAHPADPADPLLDPLLQGGSTATAGEERSRAQMSQASIGQAAADGSTAGAGPLPTLPQADVSKLVDALWGEMHDVSAAVV